MLACVCSAESWGLFISQPASVCCVSSEENYKFTYENSLSLVNGLNLAPADCEQPTPPATMFAHCADSSSDST